VSDSGYIVFALISGAMAVWIGLSEPAMGAWLLGWLALASIIRWSLNREEHPE
jgi:hypothetical protein